MESLSVGQTVVLTFGRDSNGELGRPLATEEAEAADPETDTRATGPQRVDLPTGIVSVGSGFYHQYHKIPKLVKKWKARPATLSPLGSLLMQPCNPSSS